MMKKLVGNVMSVLLEVLMWLTFVGSTIGGLGFGYTQFGVIGAVGGLVLGAIAGMLLNIGFWLISVVQEIRDYSKKWLGKYKTLPDSPTSVQIPDFKRMLAGNGRKIIISLISLILLAGIILIVKNFPDSNTEEKNVAYKDVEDNFTDSRNGKKYGYVKIGTQTWMAENLNLDAGNSACYDNDELKCQECGRLYDWNTAMKVCPNGWHLPSEAEWATLNKHDFSVIYCGRYYNGKFLHYGLLAQFWSATESNADYALGIGMDAQKASIDMGSLSKSYMRSVRCVKD